MKHICACTVRRILICFSFWNLPYSFLSLKKPSMHSSFQGITVTVCWDLVSPGIPLWIGYSWGARQWAIWKLSETNRQQWDMWPYICSSAMQRMAPYCVFMGNLNCKLQKISRGDHFHCTFIISTLFPICQGLAFPICPLYRNRGRLFFWGIRSKRLNVPLSQLLYLHVTFPGYCTHP